MPHEFYYLSQETENVLTDNVKAIARAWNKTPRYINQILSEERGDPFAPFASLFDASVKAGLPVCHWLNRLEASKAQNEPFQTAAEPSECIKEQILKHTSILDKFIDSMADGKLELSEILELLPLIEPAIEALEHLRESLTFQRGLLEKEKEKNGRGMSRSFLNR